MACVLVHIEVDGAEPSDHALAVLGEGRRIASSLGAALYAAVVLAPGSETPPSALVTTLGQGGADRIVCVTAALPQPALWATVGPALATVCEHVRPSLVLLAASAGGRDVAPRLAARLGGAFIAEPGVETGPRGEVVLSRAVYGGDLWRRISLDDLDVVAVATLDDRRARARGGDDAEVMQLDTSVATDPRVEVLGATADDGAALERARVVVTAGAGVGPEAMALIERLAQALGAELGGTRGACARGHVPPAREIGVGARRIAPDLYVVCGASGSVAHLGAVSIDAEIVAIDRDPQAPIFRAARWGLVGRGEDVVPGLLDALAAGRGLGG